MSRTSHARHVLAPVLLCALALPAFSADFADPPVLQAKNGRLDVLMIARPQHLPVPGNPVGYVYETCLRPADGNARRCPPTTSIATQPLPDPGACPTADDASTGSYAGTRLQLQPGDILRIRLINCLPPPLDAKHVGESPLLAVNPTNLHTHGLIVEPRRADDLDDPFGDYVYTVVTPAGQMPLAPPALGSDMSGPMSHDHARTLDLREGAIDYEIHLPLKPQPHPSGLFWYHPHVHGVSLNQVSAGLAGLLTIGNVHDYVCDSGATCAPGQLTPTVRHLILKDTQVTGGNPAQIRAQENPSLCDVVTVPSPHTGACKGTFDPNTPGATSGTATDATDGIWQFTVSGQVYPEMAAVPSGEIWRIANASGSASYNLRLLDDATLQDPDPKPIAFQILALDGLSLDAAATTSAAQLKTMLAGRADLIDCPGIDPAATTASKPVCATGMRMMPSARAEIWITHRDRAGAIVPVAPGASAGAVLRTVDFSTGPAGDHWPAIDLAHVTFNPWPSAVAASAPIRAMLVTGESARAVPTPAIRVGSTLQPLSAQPSQPLPQGLVDRLTALSAKPDRLCAALPAGKRRQILFGAPTPDSFGLGLVIVSAPAGPSEPPVALPPPSEPIEIKAFDHSAEPTVCLPLAPGNKATSETWELVNLAGEDHNFHIHQTRFSVLSTTGAEGQVLPVTLGGQQILMDNVPVPRGHGMSSDGSGCDGTIKAWRDGTCTPSKVVVNIPFTQVGDFVYHCHILEHEDGGMMAKISVVPSRF